MGQPAFAREVGLPDLFLKLERLPALALEPLAHAADRLPVAAEDGGRRFSRLGLGRSRSFGGFLLPPPRGAGSAEIDGQGRPTPAWFPDYALIVGHDGQKYARLRRANMISLG